jgi:hypothetical protein
MVRVMKLEQYGYTHVLACSDTDEKFVPSDPSRVSIRIETAEDLVGSSDQLWLRWTKPQDINGVPSTNAPSHSLALYHISSLLPPLFAAILEHMDFQTAPLHIQYQFHRLFQSVLDAKPDVYLDLLSVVAYQGYQARRTALMLLSTYWPRAIGHVLYSSPLPEFTYTTAMEHAEQKASGMMIRRPDQLDYSHQFMPWHFSPSPNMPQTFTTSSCRVCSTSIEGFGLYCPHCTCAIHFDCYDYPQGSYFAHYSASTATDAGKVAVYRFCRTSGGKLRNKHDLVVQSGHRFFLVNLFTLTLCFACREPLWGYAAQAYKCESCHHFIHPSCLKAPSTQLDRCGSTENNNSIVTIDRQTLRQSFVRDHQGLQISDSELAEKSYEEISVLYSTLWTEVQILDHGMALSSLLISDGFQEFELHRALNACRKRLAAGVFPSSPSVSEFFENNPQYHAEHLLFDWSFLVYATSVIKMPIPDIAINGDGGGGYLNVDAPIGADEEGPRHPYEAVSFAHIHDALGLGFHLFSDLVTRVFLQHLLSLGFYERLDGENTLPDMTNSRSTICGFPLPLGIDLSSELETLFSAVESCLSDIDLSVNEIGLLLLIRRLRPNGLATEYALRRSAKSLVSWILAEVSALSAKIQSLNCS